jgi:hypothetical protein
MSMGAEIGIGIGWGIGLAGGARLSSVRLAERGSAQLAPYDAFVQFPFSLIKTIGPPMEAFQKYFK